MNADGIKLSKRNESLRLSFLRDAGFAPETLMTYLCAMGGGVITHEERQHAEDEFRVHSIPSLISAFDLRRLSKSPGRLDDARLNLYSRSDLLQRLQTLDGQKSLIESLRKFLLSEFGQNLTEFSDDEMLRILKWSSDRVFTVKDLLSEDLKFIWANPDRALWTRTIAPRSDDADAISFPVAKYPDLDLAKLMADVQEVIARNEATESLNQEMKKVLKNHPRLLFKDLMAIVRWALMGCIQGPPIMEIVDVIGKDKAVERVETCKGYLTELFGDSEQKEKVN